MFRSLWMRLLHRCLSCRPLVAAPRLRRALSCRPVLERLEDRLTPSQTFPTATTNQNIIDDINTANADPNSGPYVLPLMKTQFAFEQPDNYLYGPNALPPIAADITIDGNGATFTLTDAVTNPMRFFYVSGGPALSGYLAAGSLTLQDLTLHGGEAKGGDSGAGGGGLGAGGAIFNQGTLILNRDTLLNNEALGGSSGLNLPGAAGGGGIGTNADSTGDGGGFGTPPPSINGVPPPGTFGGSSGSSGDAGGGGGGGFNNQRGGNGTNGGLVAGGAGGGALNNFGGAGSAFGFFAPGSGLAGGSAGDGGGGGGGADAGGAPGGGFGFGGIGPADTGGSGGGGIGGGGGGDTLNQGLQNGGGGAGGGGFGGGGGGHYGYGGGGGFGGGGGGGFVEGPSVFGGGTGGYTDADTFAGGGGAGLGGAIFNMFGTVSITDSTLLFNLADGGSTDPGAHGATGGIGAGGALFNLDGAVTINDATFAQNNTNGGRGSNGTAPSDGGAIYNLGYGSDVADNPGDATLTLNNNILANSASADDLANEALNSDPRFAFLTGSANLVMTSSSIFVSGGTTTAIPIPDGLITVTADPQLERFNENGGLTLTTAITLGSPAVGAGDAHVLPADVTTDQRGQPRQSFPLGDTFLDLGAYQYEALFVNGGVSNPGIPDHIIVQLDPFDSSEIWVRDNNSTVYDSSFAGFTDVNITATRSGSTIDILDLPASLVVNAVISVDGTINVGHNESLASVLGTLNINSNAGTLSLDDSADSSDHPAFVVGQSGITGFSAQGRINSPFVDFFQGLTIRGGTGVNHFDIERLPNLDPNAPGNHLFLNGTDTVVVGGQNQNLSELVAAPVDLAVTGNGSTTLTLDDLDNKTRQFDEGPIRYTFDPANAQGVASVSADASFADVFLDYQLSYSGVKTLSLAGDAPVDTSNLADEYNVNGTAPGTTLSLTIGTGTNHVHVTVSDASGHKLLGGDVHIDATAGTATDVTINDQPQPQMNTYDIKPTSTGIGDPITISYTNVQSVSLDGAAGGGAYDVEGTPPGVPYNISPGSGPNTFDVAAGSDTNLQAAALTSGAATTFTVGQAGTFPVTATGFPTPALTETGLLPHGVSFLDNGEGAATLAGTPDAGTGGIYRLTLTADNGFVPAATQDFVLTVDEAVSLPGGATTFTAGQAGSFTVSALGFPTPALSESGALPQGVDFTDNGDGTATLAGTPAPGTGGTYALTLTAANGFTPGAVRNFVLTVDEAPTLTSPGGVSFTVGSPGTFHITTSHAFPSPVALRVSEALPAGVTFTDNGDGTATLSGTPTAAPGVYVLTLTASNGVSPDATQDFSLTVRPIPTTVYVNLAFTGAPETDPDGAGPATAIGYDAFATIQQALDAVATGGTVVVAAGTYTEPLTLSRSVVLRGDGSATTFVTGPNGGVGLDISATGDVAIFGLTVRGFRAALDATGATHYLSLNDVRPTGDTWGGNVRGVGSLLVAGGAGDDAFYAEPGHLDRQGDDPLDVSATGFVTVDGGGGSNRLVVQLNDTNAAATVWVSGAGIARDKTPFQLFYRATGGTFGGGVEVILGDGPEWVVVQGQQAGAPTFISAAGGDDAFFVAATAASGYANLSLDGGPGLDTLAVFDQSGGAGVQDLQAAAASGALDVLYAGGAFSRIDYLDVEQILANVPVTTVPFPPG